MTRTIKQAAEDWGVSASLVRKWIAQGRVRTVRPGHEILVTSASPPPRGQKLRPEQRAAWPKGTPGRPGTSKEAARALRSVSRSPRRSRGVKN
jgi:excisionase family DNA binding protein